MRPLTRARVAGRNPPFAFALACVLACVRACGTLLRKGASNQGGVGGYGCRWVGGWVEVGGWGVRRSELPPRHKQHPPKKRLSTVPFNFNKTRSNISKPNPVNPNPAVELANVKMSMNPFCEIAVEQALRLKEAKKVHTHTGIRFTPSPNKNMKS